MRDNVLWRKQAAIVMMLAQALTISPEKALDLFYSTETCRLLSDPKTGLRLMSDGYIVEDLLNEIRGTSFRQAEAHRPPDREGGREDMTAKEN